MFQRDGTADKANTIFHAVFNILGIYFSRDASYAHKFAEDVEENGLGLKILVTRILSGLYTKGTPGMREAPLKEKSIKVSGEDCRYDSCVDNVENPKVYVIYEHSQCYPEFIIEYNHIREDLGKIRN